MKETHFSGERVCKPGELIHRKCVTTRPQFSRKSNPIVFLWRIGNQEQARTVADHFASSVVSTPRHLSLWSRQNSRLGELGPISYRIGMPNGTGNVRNFQISRKKDNLERLTEIFEMSFRKFSVPFDSEPEFSEILVEWNAP